MRRIVSLREVSIALSDALVLHHDQHVAGSLFRKLHCDGDQDHFYFGNLIISHDRLGRIRLVYWPEYAGKMVVIHDWVGLSTAE